MCNKYDRQLRYWKRYWSRYHIPKYVIYVPSRRMERSDAIERWFRYSVIPGVINVWNSLECILNEVCHMCDMKGLVNYGYDGGM